MKSTTNTTSHTHQTKRGMFRTQYLSKWQETFIKQGKWDEENEIHTFSWWFWEEMKQQWSLKMGTESVWEWDSWERRWIVTKVRGKIEKDLKTAPIFAKHVFFATEVSRHKDASSSRQNTQRQKFEKNFLSVFRDWKVYPRGNRELSRQNLWVTLATGPSTCEQVAKNDPRRRE